MRIQYTVVLVLFSVMASVVYAQEPEGNAVEARSSNTLWRLTLVDRSKIVGRIVSENGDHVEFRLVDGTTRKLLNQDILVRTPYAETREGKAQVVEGSVWEINPNRTRHLWSPSAIPLRMGEGYVSQRMLFFTALAYGITDNISLLVGSVLPAWFAGTDGFNVIAALKVAKPISETSHVAGGFEALLVPDMGVVGVGFGAYTLGEADRQVTIALGKPFALDGGDQETGDMLISLSGMYRISDTFGLVSENLIFPGVESNIGWGNILTLHGFVLRRMYKDMAWDFGFVAAGGVPGAVPWFDWTWHFGS